MMNISLDATPLLTLRKINSSQEEMSYISEMRNIIELQIEEEVRTCDLFTTKFYQDFFLEKSKIHCLHVCLNHALSKIKTFSVPVQNFEPFSNFNGDYAELPNQRQQRTDRRDEIVPTDRILCTSFSRLVINQYVEGNQHVLETRDLFMDTDLRTLQINNLKNHSDVIPESSWRRMYHKNSTLFFFEDEDMNAYIGEQMQEIGPVNISERIRGRERGESFSPLAVLKTIASPYYFVLPHQDEHRYAVFERNNNWIHEQDILSNATVSFENHVAVLSNNEG